MAPCGCPGLKLRKFPRPPPSAARRSRRLQPKPTASAAEPAAAESAAKSSATAVTAKESALARFAGLPRQPALRLNRQRGIAHPVQIEAGQRAHLPRLPADRNRLVAEIGVAGDRRQSRAARAGRAGAGVGVG